MVSNKLINQFFAMSIDEFEYDVIKIKIIKEMNTLDNANSICIFGCKYFSLKCSYIPTGKQKALISNKSSDLNTFEGLQLSNL